MGQAAAARPGGDNDEQPAPAMPPPVRSPHLWCCSCRPVSSLKAFTPHSLVFQPDCRLFCPNGVNCKLRGDRTSAHDELFLHVTRDVIKAAASSAPLTLVENRPAIAVVLPHVPRAWALPAIPAGLAGRRVVLWVHGFRQRYFRVIGLADHLARRLGCPVPGPTANDADGTAPTVLAFLWPCHASKVICNV